jgi:hypothetical protein
MAANRAAAIENGEAGGISAWHHQTVKAKALKNERKSLNMVTLQRNNENMK